MQRPSFRIAVRQGSCSSVWSDGLLAALGIAAPNSMHILRKFGGFLRMWYVVILSICAVVKVPAPTRLSASAGTRNMVFSEAGRSGLSRSE